MSIEKGRLPIFRTNEKYNILDIMAGMHPRHQYQT